MAMVQLNLRPDTATLRSFGFIALVGFGFLSLAAWREWLLFSFGLGPARVPVATTLGGLAVYSVLAAWLRPRANLSLYVALSLISYPIGFVMSFVIMGTLFYLIIAPIGFLLRAVGRDPMDRRFMPEQTSYWLTSRKPRSRGAYFRQF